MSSENNIDDLLSFEYTDEESYESDTTFKLDDVPSGERENGESYYKFYKRLQCTNNGTHTGTLRNEDVIRKHDNSMLLGSVVSSLELTQYQKSEVNRTFDEVDLVKFRTFGVEMVVFCISIVVAEQDEREFSPSFVEGDDVAFDPVFARFLKDRQYDLKIGRAHV